GTSPVTDNRGVVIGALGMFSDITERKRWELALQESETRFRNLADAIPQIVWVARLDGHVEYINQQWCDYTGLSLEQTKDREELARVIHPDDREQALGQYDQALAQGTTYQHEFRLRRASNGTYRWFLGRAVPIQDKQGHVLRWFGTC